MKKTLLIFTLCFLLLNCDSKAVKKPDNLISEDQMVAILYDLYVINAIKTYKNQYLIDNKITPDKYIYKKYKIDSLQFAQSDQYYASDVEDYEKLYQRVTKKLEQDKAEMDSLVKKFPETRKKPSAVEPESTPLKIRDSLRNSRALRSQLFKNDTVKN